jgi:hypothetical protein
MLFNSRRRAASRFVALASRVDTVDLTPLAGRSGEMAARSGLASARCSNNNAFARGVSGVVAVALARRSRSSVVGVLAVVLGVELDVIFGVVAPSARASFASNSRPNARGVLVVSVVVDIGGVARIVVVVTTRGVVLCRRRPTRFELNGHFCAFYG